MRRALWGTGCGFGGVLCGLVTVRDGRVLGDVSGAGAGALGLLFLGVGDGAGAYGQQGARAGAVWGIVVMMLSAAS